MTKTILVSEWDDVAHAIHKIIEQNQKLLEFIKDLESYDVNYERPTDYEQGAQDKSLIIADIAGKLLKEIGEE